MGCCSSCRCHPCCGFFLEGGVKAVSIIDFAVALFSLIIAFTPFISGSGEWERQNFRYDYAKLYLWIWFIFYHLCVMCLSVFLYLAARKRNSWKCTLWIIFSIILFIIWYITYFIYAVVLILDSPAVLIMQFIALYKLYSIWVICSFIKEVRSKGKETNEVDAENEIALNGVNGGLTDAEIEEFEKGGPPGGEMPGNSGEIVDPQYKTYNSCFEIKPTDIIIDYESPLGKGAFGTVYRGKYVPASTNGEMREYLVAVKTISQTADTIYFKALLQELKIMTHIGQHENIVNLIGAITSKIRENSLFIVVEFCLYGNLQDYIKSRRNLFMDHTSHDEIRVDQDSREIRPNIPNPANLDLLRTVDLVTWSLEIASGMDYLASKSVIHGDLATRNVLLTYGKKAKISDFGLSRQLYSNANYMKKQNTPLPWRWMAIESLRDLTFSTKSDVWSYGITIWEIFCLGDTPYPGLGWTQDFIKKLEGGLRLPKPVNCPNLIYEMMQNCWKQEAKDRPSFGEIISLFSSERIRGVNQNLSTNCLTLPPQASQQATNKWRVTLSAAAR